MAKQRTGGKRVVRDRDGIPVPDRLPSGKWRYRVRDRRVGRYETATFEEDPVEDANRRLPGCAAGDRWAEGKKARITTGLDSASGNVLLANVGEEYLATAEHRSRSRGYLQAIRNTLKVAADGGISDLTDDRIVDRTLRHLASLTAHRPGQLSCPPVSARTRNQHVAILRTLGEFAVRRHKLVRNPFDHLDRFDETREHRAVYTINELRRLVSDDARYPGRLRAEIESLLAAHGGNVEAAAAAAKTTPQHIRHVVAASPDREDAWWRFVVIAIYTGMRSHTIRRLTWKMVDFEARRLRVPAEVLKNRTALRAPLQPEFIAILQEWQTEKPAEAAALLPEHLVALSSDRANELTQAYLLRHGVEPRGRSVHCFRHTAAALLTAGGVSTHLTMDTIGHTSATTSKHYSHDAVEFIEQIRSEHWGEGQFCLRRQPPTPSAGPSAANG